MEYESREVLVDLVPEAIPNLEQRRGVLGVVGDALNGNTRKHCRGKLLGVRLHKEEAVGYRHIHAAVATRAQTQSTDRVDHRTGIRECRLVWGAEEAVGLGRDDVLGLDRAVPLLSVLVAKLGGGC